LNYPSLMNAGKILTTAGRAGFGSAAALLLALTGCADNNLNRPAQGSVYVEPPPLSSVFVVQDEYVYYPTYQVYYSNNRHQYTYREGNAWVARPAPAGVPLKVLQASPSVKMDFHDSPENHYAAMVQKYPKNWSSPGANEGQNPNPKNYPLHNEK
jgi:hypothetical protein